MFKDFIRRLTASYSEEEYKEWLMEKPISETEFDEWKRKQPDGIDSVVSEAETEFNRLQVKRLSKFRGIKFNSIKDVAEALAEVSEDTGYSYDFLLDRMNEDLADGQTIREAFITTAGISYEYDW